MIISLVQACSVSRVLLFVTPMDSSPPDSVRGILQARILQWVVISSSRGSSQPRDQTRVSCIADRFFTSAPNTFFLSRLFLKLILFPLLGYISFFFFPLKYVQMHSKIRSVVEITLCPFPASHLRVLCKHDDLSPVST